MTNYYIRSINQDGTGEVVILISQNSNNTTP